MLREVFTFIAAGPRGGLGPARRGGSVCVPFQIHTHGREPQRGQGPPASFRLRLHATLLRIRPDAREVRVEALLGFAINVKLSSSATNRDHHDLVASLALRALLSLRVPAHSPLPQRERKAANDG